MLKHLRWMVKGYTTLRRRDKLDDTGMRGVVHLNSIAGVRTDQELRWAGFQHLPRRFLFCRDTLVHVDRLTGPLLYRNHCLNLFNL